uniref:Uncharacterized protein n=1 Tax=Helianthus annuus TaxID=4232 RepID=A0A251U4E1_HELAN
MFKHNSFIQSIAHSIFLNSKWRLPCLGATYLSSSASLSTIKSFVPLDFLGLPELC